MGLLKAILLLLQLLLMLLLMWRRLMATRYACML